MIAQASCSRSAAIASPASLADVSTIPCTAPTSRLCSDMRRPYVRRPVVLTLTVPTDRRCLTSYDAHPSLLDVVRRRPVAA